MPPSEWQLAENAERKLAKLGCSTAGMCSQIGIRKTDYIQALMWKEKRAPIIEAMLRMAEGVERKAD